MTRDNRIFLLMMGEPVAALCANDPGAFECWLWVCARPRGAAVKKNSEEKFRKYPYGGHEIFLTGYLLILELAVCDT